MKTDNGILMIEPSAKVSSQPLIDELTRKMTAAWRKRRDGNEHFRGFHTCACGVHSDNNNHWVGNGNSLLTNSLCIHYLAYHREDVSEAELKKVRALDCGEEEPTKKELQRMGDVHERVTVYRG